MTKPAKEAADQAVWTKITKAEKKVLDGIAEREDRTISSLVRRAIREFIERQVKPK